MSEVYCPKEHQKLAYRFLCSHDRADLFLDMGLGKTVVSLTRIAELVDEMEASSFLVIAPTRPARDTWPAEIQKWTHTRHLRLSLILGSRQKREKALQKPADLYVINRENIVWLVEYLGSNWPFDGIVVDELSSFKSAKAKRFRMLKRVSFLSRYFIGLTGTPAGNGYLDLWPELYLLDKGERLGRTLGSYRETYFTPGARNGPVVFNWKIRPGAKEEIDRKLSDVCLSMSKDDWLTLPERILNTVTVRMEKSSRDLYRRFQKEHVLPLLEGKLSTMEDSESAVFGPTAATVSSKLLQMANGAVYDDAGGVFPIHDEKLNALEEIVDSASGEPILVFYSFRHDADRIKKKFPEAVCLTDGEKDTVQRWNAGKIPILLCHPGSVYGLNLQKGGHIAVWFGLTWSLEQYQQANDRLYRTGQDKPVIIHHILCAGTVDEKELAVLQDKDAGQRGLLDALKTYVKEEII